MLILSVAAVAAVVFILALLVSYNGLIQLRHDVRLAWSGMDEQLKRRYDVVPKLVEAVKSTGTTPPALNDLITAKNQAAVAFNPKQLASAETALSGAIHALLAGPLAADPTTESIKRDLVACETQIGQTRRSYNDQVQAYNSATKSFPYNVAAKLFGFADQPTFDVA